jgi:hypothetical protein
VVADVVPPRSAWFGLFVPSQYPAGKNADPRIAGPAASVDNGAMNASGRNASEIHAWRS